MRERFPSIRQALTTNGYLSRAIQDREKERSFLANIDEVDVPLGFADAARHSAFRGNPDAYRLARESLEVCSAHGKTVTLVMIGLDETLSP